MGNRWSNGCPDGRAYPPSYLISDYHVHRKSIRKSHYGTYQKSNRITNRWSNRQSYCVSLSHFIVMSKREQCSRVSKTGVHVVNVRNKIITKTCDRSSHCRCLLL